MIEEFGDGWGFGMEVGMAAQAWAGLGLLANEYRRRRLDSRTDPALLGAMLAVELADREGLVQWAAFDFSSRRYTQRSISPEFALRVWQDFREAWGDQPLRLIVDSARESPRSALAYAEVASLLLLPETRIDALTFPFFGGDFESVAGRTSWHWPLRVGFLGSERLHYQEIVQIWQNTYDAIIDFFVLGEGGEACDVLVSASPIDQVVAGISSARGRASAIALFDNKARADLETLLLLPELRASASASAIALCPGPIRFVAYRLFQEISHNLPLDVAVQRAARRKAVFFASKTFLAETRLTTATARLGRRMAARGLKDRSKNLLEAMGDFNFGAESAGATQAYQGFRDISRLEGAAAARYLQAATYLMESVNGEMLRTKKPAAHFERNRWHLIDLHVGPLLDGARSELASFPEKAVDWNSEVKLRMVLAARGAIVVPAHLRFHGVEKVFLPDGAADSGGVAERSITIGIAGASDRAHFLLQPRPDADLVEARVLLVHENRILQSALLIAPTAADDSPDMAVGSFVPLVLEGATHLSLADLDDRMRFDGAFLVNRTAGHLPLLTTVSDRRVAVDDFVHGKEAALQLRDQLDQLVLAPDSFHDPEGEATRALLVSLAHEGVLLFRRMVVDNGLEEKLGQPGARIQLVQTRPEAYLPLELVYDGAAPLPTATLCPQRSQALDRGSCGSCPHRIASEHVCPVRFWGLNRILERHLFRPGQKLVENEPNAFEPLLSRSRFPSPSAGLFARSLKAEDFPGGKKAIAALQASFGGVVGQGHTAETWNQWKTLVGQHHPSLLLLLPHTEHQNGRPWLEIGAQDLLGNANIDEAVVGGDGYPKMVLLLGCDTADPQRSHANFTTDFRHAKADIILGTLSSVLGRHVVPVADALLGAFREPWTGGREKRFGEVMAGVRRSFMKQGLPIGLALIAYGDADWILGS